MTGRALDAASGQAHLQAVLDALAMPQTGGIQQHAARPAIDVVLGDLLPQRVHPFALLTRVPAEAPTTAEFVRDLVLYFLVGDFISYFWHRWEHANRWYMRRIHSVHHQDTPPLSIWTAMVVHPVEGATVFACFHAYGILFPIHPLTFAVAAFTVTAVNMITHCGYRLPGYDLLFATAREHDIHHASREPRNVSVMLSVCDRMFGTFRKAA